MRSNVSGLQDGRSIGACTHITFVVQTIALCCPPTRHLTRLPFCAQGLLIRGASAPPSDILTPARCGPGSISAPASSPATLLASPTPSRRPHLFCTNPSLCVLARAPSVCMHMCWWCVCGAGGNACVEGGVRGCMHACAHVCRGAVHVFVVELLLFSCRFSYAISTLTSSTPLRARQVGCAVSWSAPVRLFYVLEDRRRSPLVHAGSSMLNVCVCLLARM